MSILVNYSSLPSLDKASPRIGAFNTLLDDENGALTRCGTEVYVQRWVALAVTVYTLQVRNLVLALQLMCVSGHAA